MTSSRFKSSVYLVPKIRPSPPIQGLKPHRTEEAPISGPNTWFSSPARADSAGNSDVKLGWLTGLNSELVAEQVKEPVTFDGMKVL